jgi:hypothetical protein
MVFIKLLLLVLARAFVHACQKADQHFVVMENAVDVFKPILQPLIVEPIIEVSKKPHLEYD